MTHSRSRSKVSNAGAIPSSGLFAVSGFLVVFFYGIVCFSNPGIAEGSWNTSVVPSAAIVTIVGTLPMSQVVSPVENSVDQDPKSSIVASVESPISSETHLIIPKIHVDAVVRTMGLTDGGAMAVPDSTVDVGWFGLGTRPGDEGAAVIGGHNWWNGTDGVFVHLDRLVQGDVISVIDSEGSATSFVVRETHTYGATDNATDVFLSQGGAHLNLITCSGEWDAAAQSFTTRLVVFADAVNNFAQSP